MARGAALHAALAERFLAEGFVGGDVSHFSLYPPHSEAKERGRAKRGGILAGRQVKPKARSQPKEPPPKASLEKPPLVTGWHSR